MKDPTWVEVRWRYDGIAYREDKDWNRFSRIAKIPIEKDELCRYWKICKIKNLWEYEFKVLSEREDK